MMSKTILSDARERGELFVWKGPIEHSILSAWLEKQKLKVPDELVALWRETGGGDMFETETILAPFGDVALADDVESVNAYHHCQGMPAHYLLFHTGLGLTAVRLTDGQVVRLDEDTYQEEDSFASLDAWYSRVIRSEYAGRYGLSMHRT